METKMRRRKMENVQLKLGYSSMFTVDSVGRSGCLGLFWGEETKVEIINYSHHNINAVICDRITHVTWKFKGFYGQPDPQKRHEA